MNHYKEALEKIIDLVPPMSKEYDIALKALSTKVTEPRMFSESQVLRIMERVDTEAGQTDKIGEWCHVHGSGKKYTTKQILDLLIQSISPTK